MARIACLFTAAAAASLRHKQMPVVLDGQVDGPRGDMAEVPVIQVIMVDDEPADMPANATHFKQMQVEPLEVTCSREMFMLAVNRSRAMASQDCEHKANYTNHSIDALQRGDVKTATADVVATFRDCAKLDEKCANAMAPEVVQKMRLTGAAVDHHCMTVAEKLNKDAEKTLKSGKLGKGDCEKNATKAMIKHLQKEDSDGAFEEAAKALRVCSSVPAPCDFQLAPMVVEQIVEVEQEMEEAQMVQFLMAGINKAQQLRANLSAKMSHNGTAHSKGHKASLSLIGLATSTRIVSKMQTVKF